MLIITFDHRVGQRSGKSKHFEEDLIELSETIVILKMKNLLENYGNCSRN
jgi:hypothetical protein